ncbi:UrcA family protein [Sphingomonas koreensis]|nr:UrcA family protein [Sphingomonas koreensis]
MTKLIIAAALLSSATFTPVPAVAQAAIDQAPTVRVHSYDLDLSRPAAMKVLRHRVSIAINKVCGWPKDGSMGEVMANARCRHAAVHSADAQIAALTDHSTMLAQADTRPITEQH